MNISNCLSIKIAPDKYSATATITDIPADRSVISSDVVDALREKGILTGYKILEINKLVKAINSGKAGDEFVIAEGKPKKEGKDGSEEFRFRTKLLVGKEGEQRVDFKERGLINNVRQGQILAIQRPHKVGEPGLLITGEKDEPEVVKHVKILKAGMNVDRFDEGDKITFVSMLKGHARKIFDEIQVCPDYVVPGDLDFTRGNIDFVGNVDILGDVKSGFKIKSEGDIMIGGDVEPDAHLEAGGNITVRGSIRSGKKSENIYCKGDITAGNIINSYVKSDGNVYLKELLSDSIVFCKGKFLSSWGVILGSSIEAIAGIIVNNLGKDDSNSKNSIYSGEAYLTQERVETIKEKLDDCNSQLALISKQVSIEKESASASDNDARVKNIAKARAEHAKQLMDEIEQLSEELEILKPKLITNRNAKIDVKGRVYPTCIIKIGKNEISVLEERLGPQSLKYQEEVPENTDKEPENADKEKIVEN